MKFRSLLIFIFFLATACAGVPSGLADGDAISGPVAGDVDSGGVDSGDAVSGDASAFFRPVAGLAPSVQFKLSRRNGDAAQGGGRFTSITGAQLEALQALETLDAGFAADLCGARPDICFVASEPNVLALSNLALKFQNGEGGDILKSSEGVLQARRFTSSFFENVVLSNQRSGYSICDLAVGYWARICACEPPELSASKDEICALTQNQLASANLACASVPKSNACKDVKPLQAIQDTYCTVAPVCSPLSLINR